jgi:RNA polymerase sigma factor for flagellar operon FliA
MITEIEKVGEKKIREILVDIITNKLDEKEKLIIIFVFYEELNIKEISEVLECSESEVLDLYMKTIKKIEELTAIHLNRKRLNRKRRA